MKRLLCAALLATTPALAEETQEPSSTCLAFADRAANVMIDTWKEQGRAPDDVDENRQEAIEMAAAMAQEKGTNICMLFLAMPDGAFNSYWRQIAMQK